jgi:MFS family permease
MRSMTSLARVKSALTGADFRRLLGIRLLGQCGDGFFQAALVTSVVFNPSEGSTAGGLFRAALITALPFTILGPFVGVFIDRWPRRRILTFAPLVKACLAGFVLFDPSTHAVPFYLGALAVISVNRFHLATAGAVVPRLVRSEDLLGANSVATVGGTLALLVGAFAGGKIADAAGSSVPIVVIAIVAWLAVAWIASRIRSDLAPMTIPESPELLRHQVRRVLVELREGGSALVRTPRAIGPITSITVDQIGQGVILTLALVVFRDELGQGVGSFSNVIGAGGIGVLLGILTVGRLADRLTKPRLIAVAFVVGGLSLIFAGIVYEGWSILFASAMVGLAFAWKKIPTDTLVQESLPDGYRGRVFAVYDVLYNAARLLAAGLAIPMIPSLGTRGSVALVGVVFLLWSPVLPRWIRGIPEFTLVWSDEIQTRPVAIRWGAAHEEVEVTRDWMAVRDGRERRALRLSLRDGTVLDVSRAADEPDWRIDRERDEPEPAAAG